MNRQEILSEYARILNQAEQWLIEGYMVSDDQITIDPKALQKSPIPGSGQNSHQKKQNPVESASSTESPAPPGSSDQHRRVNQIRAYTKTQSRDDSDAAKVHRFVSSSPMLQEIAAEIHECRLCKLNLFRNNTVPGIGNAGATLMVITGPPADGAGEDMNPLAPYEEEYLAKWLNALELDPHKDVFYTPVVKCRTAGGRPPQQQEIEACSAYLYRQINAVAPKALLALGASACAALDGSLDSFPALVAGDWNWKGIPALVLWSPAEVLANPGRLRRPVWESLQRLKAAWNALS